MNILIKATRLLFFFVSLICTNLLLADVELDSQTQKKLISITELAPDTTPVSDYKGDIWQRSTLLGDIGGNRQVFYEKGITIDLAITQIYQGVLSLAELKREHQVTTA